MIKKPLYFKDKLLKAARSAVAYCVSRSLIFARRICDIAQAAGAHAYWQIIHTGRCLFCHETTQSSLDLCRYCIEALTVNSPACRQCAQCIPALSSSVNRDSAEHLGQNPLVSQSPLVSQNPPSNQLCGACQNQPATVRFALAHSRYVWPADIMVQQLKYGKKLQYGRTMGFLMASQAEWAISLGIEALIPVPLSRQRWRERGFNQAEEIARTLSKRLQLPLECQLLKRHRQTGSQAGLTKKQRKQNIKGCFSCPSAIAPKRYALIDDVLTTGATANEAASVLLAAGAVSVDIWVFARTP